MNGWPDDSDEERFLYYVRKTRGCWWWEGANTEGRYGQFWGGLEVGRSMRAHRWAYEHWVGPIEPGLDVDHLCNNGLCVRPDHLEAVTRRENLKRSRNPVARNIDATHCLAGHEFSPENTRVDKRGHRSCRLCGNRRAREYQARRRQGAR